MYTDDDLETAVKAGIFNADTVRQFRRFIAERSDTHVGGEENFRLVTSFNDIFVSISAMVLVVSTGWLTAQIFMPLGFAVCALLSWVLSVYFVARRKLALPAIIFLMSYLTGVGCGTYFLLQALTQNDGLTAAIAGVICVAFAYLHWRRFHVPITIAAAYGTAALFIGLALSSLDSLKPLTPWIICALGIATFTAAMRWDLADVRRITRKSDTAFWLHMLAAPLIVHPVFSTLGAFEDNVSVATAALIVVIYIALGVISIAIDRRALMVSALAYVIFAIYAVFKNYGVVSEGIAGAGIIIGFALVFLSAYWNKSRSYIINILPNSWQQKLPLAL